MWGFDFDKSRVGKRSRITINCGFVNPNRNPRVTSRQKSFAGDITKQFSIYNTVIKI